MIESDIDHREDIEGRDEGVDSTDVGNMDDEMLRREIGRIAESSWGKKLIKRDSYDFYKSLASHTESEKIDSDTLKGVYEYAKGQKGKAETLLKYLDEAIRNKSASENDRDFLMSRIIHEPEFVSQFERAETLIKDKIKRMEEDRKSYDAIVNSELIGGKGFLQVDKFTKVKIPDENEYLKMTVPERRKFLDKAKKDMEKAEKFAEEEGDVEAQKMTKEYDELLEKAQKEGVIGKATIKKYKEAFQKVDNKEKAHWIQEMKNGNQLKRYRELWANIRKTLKGTELKKMEAAKDKMGYTQLLNEFGKAKENEGKKIESEYDKKLNDLFKKKVISKHTYNAFMQDIKSKPLEEKQQYLESFPMQMRRYEALRTKIDQMKDRGAKAEIDKMYESGDFGFSEIQARYNRLTGTMADSQVDESEKELNAIENRSVRKGIKATAKLLDHSQKVSLVSKLANYFEGGIAAKEDPITYQKRLRKVRKQHRKANIKEIKKYHHHENQSEESEEQDDKEKEEEKITQTNTLSGFETRDEIAALDQPDEEDGYVVTKEEYKKRLPRRAKTEVNRDKTFVKKTFYNKADEEKHVMRTQLNSIDGVRSLNSQQTLNKQHDDLSVNVWVENQAKELKLNEIRATVRFLRKKINSVDSQEERMAA